MAEKQQDQKDATRPEATVTGPTHAEHDAELDALLNSALDDFDKPLPSKPADGTTEKTISGGTNDNSEIADDDELLDTKWTDEFIKQAAIQFEQNVQSLLTQSSDSSDTLTPEQLGANFQKIAEATAKVITDEGSSDGDGSEFAAAISQTLRNLSEGTENLQSLFSEENIANMFSGLGVGETTEGGDFLPFMQQMMQSLLSKDILYPALKDIVDKYPAWLEENRSKLEPSEFERFGKQRELMDQVCVELERESESDSQEEKKRRFDTILDLMQKMQDCGQPPKDLVGDLGSVVTFDEHGNPCLPGLSPGVTDPSQCSVM
ncbi:peroxisomal biogenesis factor 19 [Zootermopsis nevadensis]|uniref:Peroxin-19 n=1 Tax=Zootermopsis nevadensis TaxID=136037 RepID=A0A067QRF9_ZOONE|nr:peroxisomal biogenesis factor 19 [Zootermopsis nevadensis]XP_021933152.1 peroxisomal biogenesis factor 19 [Zootermopsis nevadensis]KDR12308.1 Peroxisomal biogenesis factor 19 [Zootermopsis nevadensis]